MAIDPLLYERVSGRSADPSNRLGEALAQTAKPAKDHYGEFSSTGSWLAAGFLGLSFHWWLSIGGSILVLIVLLWAFVF
jgi:hypothetical protein